MYHHISTNVERYTLFLDNSEDENALKEGDISSASDFSITLNPALDLSPLLYLKSTEGQLCVKELFIDNLPICFTESETIDVKVAIPPSSVEFNMHYNIHKTDDLNNKLFQLSVGDFCCSDPQLALDYVNNLLRYSLNHEIMRRLVISSLDCDIFANDYLQTLSKSESLLIRHYLAIVVCCRHKIHDVLCKKISIVDDISELTLSADPRYVFSKDNENKTIDASTCLRSRAEIPRGAFQSNVNTSLFYDIDISSNSDELKTAKSLVEAATLNWLNLLGVLETEPDGSLSTENIEIITGYVAGNKQLIHHAIKAHSILGIQLEQADRRTKAAKGVFQSNFLVLSLDESRLKTRFRFNPKLFLPPDNTSVEIRFGEHMSYALGARNGILRVGPLYASTAPSGTPKLTERILHTNQLPPASITVMPRLLYVASDIIASQSRDMWLRSTAYHDYSLIFCAAVDDQAISSRVISKRGDEDVFYKIQRLNNVLECFKLKILDHNFHKLIFPVTSKTRISVVITPVPVDES